MVDARVVAAWLRETDRPPLPPGDAVSWAVLTEGTLLDAAPWSGPGAEYRPGWQSAAGAPR